MGDPQLTETRERSGLVQPFAERPLRADRVQRHQHRRFEQLLGRDARPADPRVHRVEPAIELAQDLINDPADPPDWVTRRDQSSVLNDVDIAICRCGMPRMP